MNVRGGRRNLTHRTPSGSLKTLHRRPTKDYNKAEVMFGGVDIHKRSSRTLEPKQPGLHFVGEMVDMAGWLGGWNLPWAWASAPTRAHGTGRANDNAREQGLSWVENAIMAVFAGKTPVCQYQFCDRELAGVGVQGPIFLVLATGTNLENRVNDHHPRKRKRAV